MMSLLLFTYCIIIVQTAICFNTDDAVVRHIFQENRDDRIFRRSNRQVGRFPSQGNNLNELTDFQQQNNVFNWNSDRRAKPLRAFQQRDFVFDEDNVFNDIVVPNRPPVQGAETSTVSTSISRPRPSTIPSISRPRPTTIPSISRPGSSTVAVPGMGTTRSACEDNCQATTQFDPVCGDNNVTYTNIYWFRCAQRCGRNVNIKYAGACPRVR